MQMKTFKNKNPQPNYSIYEFFSRCFYPYDILLLFCQISVPIWISHRYNYKKKGENPVNLNL